MSSEEVTQECLEQTLLNDLEFKDKNCIVKSIKRCSGEVPPGTAANTKNWAVKGVPNSRFRHHDESKLDCEEERKKGKEDLP